MQTDMTVGKPMKMILDFTIPVFIGNVFQQFYNMADAIIVGKFVGTKGLAAVGSTGTIMFLIIGFLTGLTAGFTVLTSQKFGAGKMDEMRQSVGNAALLSIIISVIMTAVSMVGMHSLLTLMHTPEDIFQDAYTYIMIICGGIFAQLNRNLTSEINAPVCIAGSVNSYQRLKEIAKTNACFFTIGSAFFDHVFGNDIAEQIDKVVTYMENLNA